MSLLDAGKSHRSAPEVGYASPRSCHNNAGREVRGPVAPPEAGHPSVSHPIVHQDPGGVLLVRGAMVSEVSPADALGRPMPSHRASDGLMVGTL
jgi:hypothetical protein